ncbi:MAG: PTS sugar transporter subunit IIA [Pseudomonadota bacterium]|nr:PTS sugar transporter subunit IIA [Pseudomonadota bacterium]
MNLVKATTEDFILLNQKLSSKKNALEFISTYLSQKIGIEKDMIFQNLYAREKLGTTALGNGVALPHAKIDSLENIQTLLIQLASGIDFDAVDKQQVDVIFVLLVPNVNSDVHVKALADIASILDNADIMKKVRKANSPAEIIGSLNSL